MNVVTFAVLMANEVNPVAHSGVQASLALLSHSYQMHMPMVIPEVWLPEQYLRKTKRG